jgi:hypothetical protein
VAVQLREAVAQALATPALASRLEALGQLAATDRPDTRRTIATELATWKKLFADRSIVIDG